MPGASPVCAMPFTRNLTFKSIVRQNYNPSWCPTIADDEKGGWTDGGMRVRGGRDMGKNGIGEHPALPAHGTRPRPAPKKLTPPRERGVQPAVGGFCGGGVHSAGASAGAGRGARRGLSGVDGDREAMAANWEGEGRCGGAVPVGGADLGDEGMGGVVGMRRGESSTLALRLRRLSGGPNMLTGLQLRFGTTGEEEGRGGVRVRVVQVGARAGRVRTAATVQGGRAVAHAHAASRSSDSRSGSQYVHAHKLAELALEEGAAAQGFVALGLHAQGVGLGCSGEGEQALGVDLGAAPPGRPLANARQGARMGG
ncbi:hypothetical protein C8J57DRAFT_1238625 [Mycena rebaudengoi]|nr:hypothetical protein C8J57DRAFT_1238625 [Mycena rebaudengoi]